MEKKGNYTPMFSSGLTDELLQVFRMIPVPMVISRADGSFEFVNPALLEMLGYSYQEIYNPSLIISHPSSKEINKLVRQQLKENPFTPLTVEKQYVDKEGNIIEGLLTIVAQPTETGEVKRYISQIVDLTKNKRRQEELQLAALLYENCSEAMLVTDSENKIIAVNPAFYTITGYSFDEVRGKSPSVLSSGYHDGLFYSEMQNCLEKRGSWKGEIWNKRKNGQIYPQLLAINTVYDDEGFVHRRVALFSDLSKQKEAEKIILHQANYDELTELPNRRNFIKKLKSINNKTNDSKVSGAVLFIDIDRFKEVNDSLGHEYGDELLKEASGRLLSAVGSLGEVARYSGDEFIIMLTQVSSQGDIDNIAQRVLDQLSPSYQLFENNVYVTASIGIARFPQDSSDHSTLLRFADQAMYMAKNQGRNQFCYYTPELQSQALEKMKRVQQLREAIAEGQFELYFQPIIDLKSKRVVKAEALIRWNHPMEGFIPPDIFIPIAEESGLINVIGEWVFKAAIKELKKWQQQDIINLELSINVSPVQLNIGGVDSNCWSDYLVNHNVLERSVVIEITENVLMQSSQGCWDKLRNLNDNGFKLSIDDFGTGYSSLSYLKEFKADYLKIDKSFVSNLTSESDDSILCEAMIVMAHKLGIKVIAEGIETEQQLGLLQQAGCDLGQGWLFAKALPSNEFMDYVKETY